MSLSTIRRLLFPLVFVFGFLPVLAVSCEGKPMAKLNMYNLAIGTEIKVEQAFGPPKTQKTDSEPLATVALLVALVGAGIALANSTSAAKAAGVAGIAGLVVTVWLKSKLDTDAVNQGHGVIRVEWDTGGYLILAAFGLAAIVSFVGARQPTTAAAGDVTRLRPAE